MDYIKSYKQGIVFPVKNKHFNDIIIRFYN